MNKKAKRKELLAPIKNINRVLLICVFSFLVTGTILGITLPNITSSKKLSMYILEITTYTALGLPMIIFARLNFKGSKDIILPKFDLKTIKSGVACAIIAYPLMHMAISLAGTFEVKSEMTSEQMVSAMTSFSFIENVIRMALLPAVIEELVFRSGLLGVYSKKNVIVGIFLSSIMFALLHGNLYQIPYAFVGGIVFAYAAYTTNNSGTAIVAHFIVNFISILISYASNLIEKYNPEKLHSIEGVITGLLMAGGVLMSGYLLSKVFKKQITPRSLNLKEDNLNLSSFITMSLAFTISILLFLTFIFEEFTIITA